MQFPLFLLSLSSDSTANIRFGTAFAAAIAREGLIPMRGSVMEFEHGIDLIGKKILQELAADGRLPFAELGRKVGLSPSATAERVRQLESLGFIRGYRAEIDLQALGFSITAFVRLTCEGNRYRQFLKFLPSLQSVQECHHLTGGDAFLLKVVLSSVSELETLIEKLLAYGSPTTSMVLSTPLEREPAVELLKHL
jgi:Lrp/AsnC family leucine-responsive transcriptional regulator